jgi:hypothetical protein
VSEAWLFEAVKGGRWHVVFEGDTIVTGSRDPEHDACRALLARGVTGKVTFRHPCCVAGMIMDIESSAGFTVKEGPLRTVKFGQESLPDRSPAAVSPSDRTMYPEGTKGALEEFSNREDPRHASSDQSRRERGAHREGPR